MLMASGNLRAAAATSSSASSTSPEQAAREEIVRRQEAQITARKLIDEGEKLYYKGQYQDAIVRLEEAVKILPRAKATEIDYSRALQGLTLRTRASLMPLFKQAITQKPANWPKERWNTTPRTAPLRTSLSRQRRLDRHPRLLR